MITLQTKISDKDIYFLTPISSKKVFLNVNSLGKPNTWKYCLEFQYSINLYSVIILSWSGFMKGCSCVTPAVPVISTISATGIKFSKRPMLVSFIL